MHFKYIIEGGGRDDKCNMKIKHCMIPGCDSNPARSF